MSAYSERSTLIDSTFSDLNLTLSGRKDGLAPEQIIKILESRVDKLKNFTAPFGLPSEASRKKLNSGSITLSDGVTLKVDETIRDQAYAVSSKYKIDEVDAYVLVRSFVSNGGLVDDPGDVPVEEIVDRFMPFYFRERLGTLRCLASLFRACDVPGGVFQEAAVEALQKIAPEPVRFAKSLVSDYLRKISLPIPEEFSKHPRSASSWAIQNAREQLAIVEVLFWSLQSYVPANAAIIVELYTAAYDSDFGYQQENSTLMFDEDGAQIQRDIASLWILLTISVLNLEDKSVIPQELPRVTNNSTHLFASPSMLELIHNKVMSRTTPGYVCTILAWAFYLHSLSTAWSQVKDVSPEYAPFFKLVRFNHTAAPARLDEQVQTSMVVACLRPEAGLFSFLLDLLTDSPLFVTSIATKKNSALSDPDLPLYRAIVKGLIIATLDYQPVEYVPDFTGFVDVWIALFGQSRASSVAPLCRQYWDYDWRCDVSRRAIIDVARSRFPVQFRPLIRLLRAMTGSGSLSPYSVLSGVGQDDSDRKYCCTYVYHYLRTLQTYTQVLPAASRTGPNAIYDRMSDRVGPSSRSGGMAYTNVRPLKLPGGTLVPVKSTGRLLCPDSATEPVVIAWQHQHCGWDVILEVLSNYVKRRQSTTKIGGTSDTTHGRRSDQPLNLTFEDIGMEESGSADALITEILDLILSLIGGNLDQAVALMELLEEERVNNPQKSSTEPDLVQLIIMILEDALNRSSSAYLPNLPSVIAPALSILAALLPLEIYSNRVWLYLRSSSIFNDPERGRSPISSILATERASGEYAMTIALLHLIVSLARESVSSFLRIHTDQPKLQTVKDEVLLRAVYFVHVQVWVEHATWRYARFSDRFIVGRLALELFICTMDQLTAISSNLGFAAVTQYMANAFVYKATTTTISPLVQIIATSQTILSNLRSLSRFTEVAELSPCIENALRLSKMILAKNDTKNGKFGNLLRGMLCADVSIGPTMAIIHSTKINPVEALSNLVSSQDLGTDVPLQAIQVLTCLCLSIPTSATSSSLIGYLTDAESTVAKFIRIVKHPYDELALRVALWRFFSTTVDTDPALASLIVNGGFHVPSNKGKAKAEPSTKSILRGTKDLAAHPPIANALDAACEFLKNWRELWEANAQLLASILGFIKIVWQHGPEHYATMQTVRQQADFWKYLMDIAREDLGPVPDYITNGGSVELDDGVHSDLHDAVSVYAYRCIIKAHAVSICGSDLHLESQVKSLPTSPLSFKELQSFLQEEDTFPDAISEFQSSSYDTDLYERLNTLLAEILAPLNIESLRAHIGADDRSVGDGLALSLPLFRDLSKCVSPNGRGGITSESFMLLIQSINLNMSLVYAQCSLLESWHAMLHGIRTHLKDHKKIRDKVMAMTTSVARNIADERRQGDMMFVIHEHRLLLLGVMLEVAWYPTKDNKINKDHLIAVMDCLEKIAQSETFPMAKSLAGSVPRAFHIPLLQIIHFCIRSCHRLFSEDNAIFSSKDRVIIGKTLNSVLSVVIDSLRVSFDSAMLKMDPSLDRDMELLVAVFEQSIKSGLHPSSVTWLTRCQEKDVLRAALDLLERIDMVGLSDLSYLRSHGRPIYAAHILRFFNTLANIPAAAERLAGEGLVSAYCNSNIAPVISSGAIDVALPELPGETSPVHRTYCSILTSIVGVTGSLSTSHYFIDSQLIGLIQVFDKQISRALQWSNDGSLTLPFLDELELTVEIFYLIANGSSPSSLKSGTCSSILQIFSDHAMHLLQQINYALTHPKHLLSLLEPVTAEEKTRLDLEIADASVNSMSELLDPDKRPILVTVIRKLFDITTKILSTLIISSEAENVLSSDSDEWPLHHALLVPHSKVTIMEPASIGTLLELGNCAFDILRFLTNQKPGPSKPVVAVSGTSRATSDFKSNIRSAMVMFECIMLYVSTQFVMWLVKEEGETAGEMDLDEHAESQGLNADMLAKDRDRRTRRKSSTLADRLRRGMTGEMAGDLQALVAKAKPVLEKSAEILGLGSVDLTHVLKNFIEDHMGSS